MFCPVVKPNPPLGFTDFSHPAVEIMPPEENQGGPGGDINSHHHRDKG
jgi:hypothetical protein